jgi:glycosyltransferase involved in cell wall biosynthesis
VTINPIKTVHITNYYHKNSGGISTSYNHLLEYADRHQRPISLIVPGETDSVEKIGEFAKIFYVAAQRSPFFDKRYRVIMPWQFMFHGTRIREILVAENPDLIEVCDKYLLGLLAAMIRKHYFLKLGRPLLVHFSCERMDDNIAAFVNKGKFGKWFARQMMSNYNAPLYDFYIANSAYTGAEYANAVFSKNNSKSFLNRCWRFFRAPKLPLDDRIFICSRGGTNPIFSTKNFSAEFRREIKKETGIPPDSKILFYAGRLSPEKNIGILIELMKILGQDKTQDFRLLIAGDGPQKEAFRAEAEQKVSGKIKMLGHLTDKQKLANLYANCDVFVHPNPREPYGIGPLEAMASGVPVVAPNSGGILTYATPENAWLVEPTAENFASAIKEILVDETTTNPKITRALETVKNSNWEKSSEEVFAVYEEIYQRFQSQNELFAYREKPQNLDFTEVIS